MLKLDQNVKNKCLVLVLCLKDYLCVISSYARHTVGAKRRFAQIVQAHGAKTWRRGLFIITERGHRYFVSLSINYLLGNAGYLTIYDSTTNDNITTNLYGYKIG